MPTKQTQERLNLLFTVLIFSSEKTAIFKTGERICINQERGSLFDTLNFNAGIINKSDVRMYSVPEHIEKKIKNCVVMMQQINWVPTVPQDEENNNNV
jgi:hypothetical protein